jgi:hypothetical protein
MPTTIGCLANKRIQPTAQGTPRLIRSVRRTGFLTLGSFSSPSPFSTCSTRVYGCERQPPLLSAWA